MTSLVEQIKEIYPELEDKDFFPGAFILIRDDSDGQGEYIARWEYSQPIPAGLKLGK